MKKINSDGTYSDDYLFVQMNKFALMYVHTEAKIPDKVPLFMMRADVEYKKRLHSKYVLSVHCDKFSKIQMFNTLYFCNTEVLDNKGEVVASANFIFIEQPYAYND